MLDTGWIGSLEIANENPKVQNSGTWPKINITFRANQQNNYGSYIEGLDKYLEHFIPTPRLADTEFLTPPLMVGEQWQPMGLTNIVLCYQLG